MTIQPRCGTRRFSRRARVRRLATERPGVSSKYNGARDRIFAASRNLEKSSVLISPRRILSDGGAFLAFGVMPCARSAKRDVGRERRFAHPRPPGKDDEIGFLQSAKLAVEIA